MIEDESVELDTYTKRLEGKEILTITFICCMKVQ